MTATPDPQMMMAMAGLCPGKSTSLGDYPTGVTGKTAAVISLADMFLSLVLPTFNAVESNVFRNQPAGSKVTLTCSGQQK